MLILNVLYNYRIDNLHPSPVRLCVVGESPAVSQSVNHLCSNIVTQFISLSIAHRHRIGIESIPHGPTLMVQ